MCIVITAYAEGTMLRLVREPIFLDKWTMHRQVQLIAIFREKTALAGCTLLRSWKTWYWEINPNLNQLGHWITISIQIGSDTSLGMKTVQSDHTLGDSMSWPN